MVHTVDPRRRDRGRRPGRAGTCRVCAATGWAADHHLDQHRSDRVRGSSGLPEGDPCPRCRGAAALQPLQRAAAPLVQLVRRFRPHVILSYDENGRYPHPDHVRDAQGLHGGVPARRNPRRTRERGSLDAGQLVVRPRVRPERFLALHEALEARGLTSRTRSASPRCRSPIPRATSRPCPGTRPPRRCAARSSSRRDRAQQPPAPGGSRGMFFAVSAEPRRRCGPGRTTPSREFPGGAGLRDGSLARSSPTTTPRKSCRRAHAADRSDRRDPRSEPDTTLKPGTDPARSRRARRASS
ncbi:hypothetical protein QJS66_08430 [Kocuria rhizophila]|nr:hypothetical protein QJS66_08430 [Kocuria rhizophila]